MDKKNLNFNYIYFGLFFLVILTFSICNIFISDKIISGTRIYFLIHAFLQSFLEVAFIAVIAWVIYRFFSKKLFYAFIGFTFFIGLFHIIDFVLIRMMNFSFFEALDFVLGESWTNFIEMLYASNVPMFWWIIMGIFALIFPFIGIGIYILSHKLAKKYPLKLSFDYTSSCIFSLFIGLLIWDYSVSPAIHPDVGVIYRKGLPWKCTFLKNESPRIRMPCNLKRARREKNVIKELINKDFTAKKTPNIYLFVIESIREDFITKKCTPNIYDFKNNNISFDLSLANANGTQVSWYSIFHSNFPLYWAHTKRKKWKSGSIPLYMLKKMGYKVHVYSSSGLKYYGMDEVLFGKNHFLLDTFHQFNHIYPKQAYQADEEALDSMLADLNDKKNHEKNVFIIFLDSTHFDYSWPESMESQFSPIANGLSMFSSFVFQKNIEGVKNRYRNSLHFVDNLFEKFSTKLKQKKIYDDSIIVLAADHGEEFLEHGQLFHASHLSQMQTEIPLYYKFGKNEMKPAPNKMTCHMQIFPSILHYLTGNSDYSKFFDGTSIFEETDWPFVITARYNASRDPYEFLLHTGEEKMTFRFHRPKRIFSCRKLEVQSYRKRDDTMILKVNDEKLQDDLGRYKTALLEVFSK